MNQLSAPRGLYIILFAALIARTALVCVQPVTSASIDRLPDQREYLSLAQNLLHHRSLSFFDARFHQEVYAYRMPGYPLFVAACGAFIPIVRGVQCVIDTSTVLAVYLIACKLTGCTRVGRIAALLIAFNPFYIYFSSLILSETLFAAAAAWGLYLLLQRTQKPEMAGMGILLCAALIKPTGILLLPTLVCIAWSNFRPILSYRLSAMAGVCMVLLSMWAYRNYRAAGSWIWTTTNGGITLYDGFHTAATGASDQRFIAAMPILLPMNEVQRSHFLAAAARHWATQNKGQLPALSFRKILRGWSPVPLSEDFSKPLYCLISAGYSIPFDLLCVTGMFSSRLQRRDKLLLMAPALVVTIAMVLSVGSIRYRMPAEAPLAVLAAVAAMDLGKHLRARTSKREMQNLV